MHILKVTLMIFLFVFHGLNANGMSCKEATEDGKSTGVEGVKAKDTELSYVAPTGAGKADVNLKSGKLLVNHVKSVRLTGSEVIENILEPAFGDRINDEKISLEVGSDSVTIGALTLKNGVSFPEYIFSSSANNTELSTQSISKNKVQVNLPLAETPLEFEGELYSQFIRLFNNHPLHPYIKSSYLSGNYYRAKGAQLEGQKAIAQAIKNKDTEFLYVAPTGVGKTDVIYKGVEHMLDHFEPGLIIVAADQIELVDQLHSNLYQKEKLREYFSDKGAVIHWKEDNKADFKSLMETVNSNKENNQFTILYTVVRSLTLQTLVSAKGRGEGLPSEVREAQLEYLSEMTRGMVYDEAHHAGANGAAELILTLQEQSKALQRQQTFLLGATATPFHYKVDLVSTLFNDKAFLALVDNHISYFQNGPRDISQLFVNQLQKSMEKSYIRSIRALYLVIPGENGIPENVFVQNKGKKRGSRYSLDEAYIPTLLDSMSERFKAHKFAFMTASTIKEAELISDYINANIPGKKSRTFHSKLTNDSQILKDMRAGEFNFLVTVKKADEGLDLPFLTLYVNFNRSSGPRQTLQRLGRIIRLDEGKGKVEVISMFDLRADNITDELGILNSLINQSLFKIEPNKDGGRDFDSDLELFDKALKFDYDNSLAASENLAKFFTNALSKENKVAFWNKEDSKIEIKSTNYINKKLSKKEILDILRAWYRDHKSFPGNPYLEENKGASQEEKDIYKLIVEMGGVRKVKELLNVDLKFNNEEAFELVSDWYVEEGYIPSSPYAAKEKSEELTPDEKYIWELIQQLGGKRKFLAQFENAQKLKESPREQSVVERTEVSTSREVKEVNEQALTDWMNLNHDWPVKESTDQHEVELAKYLTNNLKNRKTALEQLEITSPILKFSNTNKENRFSVLLDYILFQHEVLGSAKEVELISSKSLNEVIGENASVYTDSMLKLELQLKKWIKTVSNKEILAYLKEHIDLSEYPLIQLYLDKRSFFINWVKANKAMPQAYLSKSKVTEPQRIERSIHSWYAIQSSKEKLKLKHEIGLGVLKY